MKKRYFGMVLFLLLTSSITPAEILPDTIGSPGTDKPLIFPIPYEMQLKEGTFYIDKQTFIVQSEKESEAGAFLNRLLAHELADKYYFDIAKSKRKSLTKKDKFILMGTSADPLIKKYCEQHGLVNDLKALGEEGYILSVSENAIVVAANSNNGTLFGFESLRQILHQENDKKIFVPQLLVKDKPLFPFRGIKLYLPGKENIPFFKRFIKDFAALYKFNKIILELNANMRLDKHPELNIAAVEFAKHLNSSRLGRPPGLHKEYQNSSHQDNADGEILEKADVADLVNYMRKFNIEVIPELPSLTHAYYLLGGHKDLAENPNQPYPDTYNPLKPEIYKIYFDVLDEYIDVIHPSMIHVGHDEWRMEMNTNPLTRGKDYGKLYADDLNKIYDYLARKGIQIGIWGDHLLESVRGKDYRVWKTSTGYEYKIPGALKPEQVKKLIPKDILIFNWFWSDVNNDKQLSDFGFKQVYGNLRPEIGDLSERKNIKGVLGGAPSSWAGTTEFNIGKDQLYDFLGSANLLWSQHYLSEKELAFAVEPMVKGIHQNLSGNILPSDDGAEVIPISISNQFNSSLNAGISDLKGAALKTGRIQSGNKIFELTAENNRAIVVNDTPDRSESIHVAELNKDVSTIIFLHACANAANNKKAYEKIYDFENTADPLGYYEVQYEDGLVETIPLRYGVNILDWHWRQRISDEEKGKEKYNQDKYAYKATAVEGGKEDSRPVTFFAFEWKNPHFGKKIKQITLHSVRVKQGNENAVILLAVSVAENKKVKEATGTEDQ